MSIRTTSASALVALALICGSLDEVSAQVVEGRDAEANPASVIFRSTLYGAGTGLVLGGAYILVADDADTGDVLRWSTAGGAAAGVLIGLAYLATRSEPENAEGEVGMLRIEGGNARVSLAGAVSPRLRSLPGIRLRTVDLNLVSVGF